jgi:signal transduction histidine kinase/CheY-like chemotaxis protein
VDLSDAHKIWAEISAGAPLDDLLQCITKSCLSAPRDSAKAPRFATLGLLSPEASQPASGDRPVDFCWSAGDNLLGGSAVGEPIASIWRNALETRATAGGALPARWAFTGISRVIAVPLLIAGASRGVLVVGYPSSSATLSDLERVELRANLAAAAIAMSGHSHLPASMVEFSQFLVQHSGDAAFLLNSRLEITHASSSGRFLLTAPEHLVSRRSTISDRAQHSLGAASNLFKPAEWRRVSTWMEKISESGDGPSTHSIATELLDGRQIQLHASVVPGDRLVLLVQHAPSKEVSASDRATIELLTVLEWIDQGVLVFDENEILRAMNSRFPQLFGLSTEALNGANTLRALVGVVAPHVSDPPQFAANWWSASRGTETGVREELHIVQPASRTVERLSRQVLDSAGVRIGRIEVYRDLTALQLLESELHKSGRLAALGQKMSGVAHELSNPLTTVLGYAQRLLRKSDDSPHREDIQRIFSEADRASSILRQLLGSVRESPTQRHPVDLNSLILRTVDLQRMALAAEEIRVDVDLAPDLQPVLADGGQLQQVLLNLISNARQALLQNAAEGTIFLRTGPGDSGRVLLEISDSGPGIAPAHLHRVFDPFFTTKPAGSGTGLGLFIVKGLVQQNHGNIRVHSAPRQGATFSMDFPAASGVAVERPLQLVRPLVSVPVLPSSARVLVVEDEPTVAQLIGDLLTDLGYTAELCHDARAALASALHHDYALIICDIKMPGLDGPHFYRALRESGRALAARFLFVTGDVLGKSTQEFLREHALPYVAKPFRMEEFMQALATVLGAARDASNPALRVPSSGLSLISQTGHG